MIPGHHPQKLPGDSVLGILCDALVYGVSLGPGRLVECGKGAELSTVMSF